MENPAFIFPTGMQMSTKGNGDHSRNGCDSGRLVSCTVSTDSSDFDPKTDSIALINDIEHQNNACFSPGIQDGDQTELFYSIVCGSDLPVGENVSVASPRRSYVSKYEGEPHITFSESIGAFSTVDVVAQDMDEPLDHLDFKLEKSIDHQQDDSSTMEMEERKRLNESISAIAESFGIEDLIPETFNIDISKDIFPISNTASAVNEKQCESKEPVRLHITENVPQYKSKGMDSFDTLKKKNSKDSAIRMPIVMENGSILNVLCTKDSVEKGRDDEVISSNNIFTNTSTHGITFQDLEEDDNPDSTYAMITDNMHFTDGQHSPAVVGADAVECILQTDMAENCSSEQLNSAIISEVSVSDIITQVLEESAENATAEATTISITTDNVNQKMQLVFTTSQGQRTVEFSTRLGSEQITTDSTNPEANYLHISDIRSQNRVAEDGKDSLDEEEMCEEDLMEFVEKIAPRRGKCKKWMCLVDNCGQVFTKECKLKVHMISHRGARPFKCTRDGCNWAFTTPYRLRRHCKTHVGKKDYVCDFEGCTRKFTTIYNLNTHKKRHLWPNTLICPSEGCEESFANRRKFELHLRVHKEIEAPYSCKVCSKKYYSANCIASHYRTHQYSEDDFKCPFENCGKKYDKFCRLKQHVRHHTGERPYSCPAPDCDWSFMSASKLTRHMRKHTGERKFVCTEPGCGKSFMRPEHLKGHIVIHSGDKPFECPHENCKARFTAKSSLYVHVKRHCASGLKIVYPCPVAHCVKKYNNKTTLKQHVQKMHPGLLEDKQFVFPEKLELTMPVSICVDKEPKRNGANIITKKVTNRPTKVALSMPTLVPTGQSRINTVKVSPPMTSVKLKAPAVKFTLSGARDQSMKTKVATDSSSGCLTQENQSGSARTDYSFVRAGNNNNNRKLWSFQNRVRLGLPDSDEIRNSEVISCLSLPLNSPRPVTVRSPDVLLASSSVALHESVSETLGQTHFLNDEPASSSIYHEDSILVNNAAFSSELPITASLLSDDNDSNDSVMEGESYSAANTVDEFNVSAMSLQCLE